MPLEADQEGMLVNPNLRRRSLRATLARFALSGSLLVSTVTAATAQCVEISLYGAEDYKRSQTQAPKKRQFRMNEMFVACVRLDKESFLTLWDAPPLGDPERLFPNRFTDSDPKTIARKVPAGTHCYGASDTIPFFPLFHDPKDGVGPGKISAFATDTLDNQPQLADFVIIGQTVRRNALDFRLRNTPTATTCEPVMKAFVDYRVEQ